MFWKAFLIFNSVKMTFTGFIEPKKVVLLENRFWGESQDQVKTNKGYLSEVEACLGDGKCQMLIYRCFLSEGFWCKLNGNRYNVIKEKNADEIKSYMASSKDGNRYLRLWFTFTDIPIINEKGFQLEIKEKEHFMTYNVIKKSEEKFTVNVKTDGIDIRMISIKESFRFYLSKRFIRIGEIVTDINRRRELENYGDCIHCADFELYYFRNRYVCFENLKKFSESIRRLKIVEDYEIKTLTAENTEYFHGKNPTLTVSQFIDRLRKKFDALQGKTLDLSGPSRVLSTGTLILLFKKACNHLKEKIMYKKIFIAIGDDYGTDYYLEKLFNLLYPVITSIYKAHDTITPEEEDEVFEFLFKSLDDLLEDLEISSILNVYESEYVHKYFAELLGRKPKDLKDFIIIEKMVIDHRNMTSYIYNTIDHYDKTITRRFIYRSPYFADDFKYRLLEGIVFDTSQMSEWEMYGITNENNRIKLEENVDYFNLYEKSVEYSMEQLKSIGCVNANMYIFGKTFLFCERMRELNVVTIEFHNDRVVSRLGTLVFGGLQGHCMKNYGEIKDLLKR